MPFAEVAVYSGRPHRETFTYAIPDHLTVRVGDGVYVPFGRQVVQGVVLQLTDNPAVAEPREVLSLVEGGRLLTVAQAMLTRWIADGYLAPIFSAVALFLPPGFERRPRRLLSASPGPAPARDEDLSSGERAVLAMLAAKGELAVDSLTLSAGARVGPVVRSLLRRGLAQERYELAPPGVREKVETRVALDVDAAAARSVIAAWPQSRRSRQADLLERLVDGPLPLPDARRLAGGRAGLDRMLDRGGLLTRDGDTVRAIVDAETLTAAVHSLRRTRAERAQVAALDALLGGAGSEVALRAESGATRADIAALADAGLLRRERRHVERDPLADHSVSPVPPPALTDDQTRAYRAIHEALECARAARALGRAAGACFLLHGVTGSGKTEVYLAAVDHVRSHGGRAIVLVPEIALTPQTVDRFAARFPGRVAVQHSALSLGEAYDQWQRIRRGDADVVIGSRSALFAPLPDLALIVVDEEHEWTYKQTDPAPRYHVREVVEEYCRLTGAVAIFGSATPDVVTAARAGQGRYQRLDLPQRVRRANPADPASLLEPVPLPAVDVVDLREELRAGNRSIFSRLLAAAIDDALAARQQVMLFLNRRGAAVFVCRACGEAASCPRCSVPLTFHSAVGLMRCHECGHSNEPVTTCPACGADRLRKMGLGTQRLEEEVVKRFPAARTLRWDRDTAAGKGGHERLLARFLRGDADVLIGTQMIAKGLDLPAVTLVGVVSADLSLRLPDYTGPERTFQLLTQVAGRAARGPRGGRVVVQTYAPDHYAITAAAAHDYQTFFDAEMAARAAHDYPPFGRLARLVHADSDTARARDQAQALADFLRRERDRLGLPGPEVLGPTPAYVYRRRGRYRWQITLRGADPLPLLRGLDFGRGWTVDVDPVSLL